MSDDSVVVVGAGPAGLSAAHHLRGGGRPVIVLEAGARSGGMLQTELTDDGYVIERGPDSIITTKPEALDLAVELGLESRIVRTRPETRGAYVVRAGRLVRIPKGFNVVAPASPLDMARSPILSLRGKMRAALDMALPRGAQSEDESLGHFVRRRFGDELLERLAQPMAAGIYGEHPSRLSLRATMPRFLDMEEEHRSVTLGLMRSAGANQVSGARYGLFINFDCGSEVLAKALAAPLEDRIHLESPVMSIERAGAGWSVRVQGGRTVTAGAVLLAVPAWRAAKLLQPHLPRVALELDTIPYGSAATVTMAWPRDQVPHALDASGFVVPAIEGRLVLAATWASEKWPGRAPSGKVMIRVFLGGNGRDEVVRFDDLELVQIARRGLHELMGIDESPLFTRIDRYVRAMPRLQTGHLSRIARVEAELAQERTLAISGGFLRGVGIPDTLASGRRAAEKLLHAA